MNFFDFLNSINTTKKDLLEEDPLSEKDYNSFMVNRGLSYFHDTVMYANEMNRYSSLPKDIQYRFYLSAISKKKRFSKWHKKDQNSEDLKLIMNAYSYSSSKAAIALEILSTDQLQQLRNHYDKGGK